MGTPHSSYQPLLNTPGIACGTRCISIVSGQAASPITAWHCNSTEAQQPASQCSHIFCGMLFFSESKQTGRCPHHCLVAAITVGSSAM